MFQLTLRQRRIQQPLITPIQSAHGSYEVSPGNAGHNAHLSPYGNKTFFHPELMNGDLGWGRALGTLRSDAGVQRVCHRLHLHIAGIDHLIVGDFNHLDRERACRGIETKQRAKLIAVERQLFSVQLKALFGGVK